MSHCNSTIPGSFPVPVLQPLDSNRMDFTSNPNNSSMILTTPTKSDNKRNSLTPSSSSFRFTPTKGRRLYPPFGSSPPNYSNTNRIFSPPNNILDENICDKSYMDKDNPQFLSEMELLQNKLFSSNIRNNVLGELGDRYEKVRQEELQNIQKLNANSNDDDMKRRNSHRYSWVHRNRFSKMDSVSNHYAAKKTRQSITPSTSKQTTPKQRKLVTRVIPDMDEEMDTQGDKRIVNPRLESATKRLKMPTGNFREVDSPTRSHDEKLKIKEQQLNKLQHQGMPPPPITTRLFASIPKPSPNRSLYPNLNKKKSSISLSRKVSSQTLNKKSSSMNLSSTRLPAPTNLLRKKSSMDLSARASANSSLLRKKSSMDLSARASANPSLLRKKSSIDLATGRSNSSQIRNKPSMDFSKPHIPTLSRRTSSTELSKSNPPMHSISRKSSLQTLSKKPSSISLRKKQSTLSLAEYTTSKESPTRPLDSSHRIPSYLLPTKASLQKSAAFSKEKDKKGIYRSPSRTNIPKHMDEPNSKISPSRSCVNLASYLSPGSLIPPPDDHTYFDKSPGSARRIPKSKTMSNISISPSNSLRDLSSPVAPSNIPRLVKPLTLEKLSNYDDFSDDVFSRLDKPARPWR